MRILPLILILLILLPARVIAKKVNIKSRPEGATIFLLDKNGKQAKKIGTTPYSSEIDAFLLDTGSKYAMIEISFSGFEPYRVLFTNIRNVDIDMAVKLTANKKAMQIKKYDKMITEMFAAQRLIRNSSYNSAISSLSKLEDEFGDFSTISELKAAAYYLGRKPAQALTYYRKAFSKNTDNVDAYRMKVYLEKKLGISEGAK